MTPEQSLLSLHLTHPEKTRKYLSNLPSTTITSLVSSLSTTPSLLPALWSYPALHAQILSLNPPPSSLSNHLVSLSRTSDPATRRVKTITRAATAAFHARNYPLLLPLLQALSRVPGAAAEGARGKILTSFLASAGGDLELVSSLLEVRLKQSEHRPVVAFIMQALSQTSPSRHAPLLPALLASPIPLAKPILYILSKASKTTLISLHACILDNPNLTCQISITVTRAVTQGVAPVTPSLLQTLFILLTHADEPTADSISDHLEKLLSADIKFLPTAGGSVLDPRTAVFVDAVRHLPEGCESDVCDFCERLLWKSSRKWGMTLLEEVFVWHTHSRKRVLKSVIIGLATTAPNVVHAAFLGLFRSLATNPVTAVAMRSCLEVLRESLDYVVQMPAGLDATFVELLSGVIATVPSGRDKIMIYLRKVSAARARRELRIACQGLISVLSVDAGEDMSCDACDMLVWLSESDVREYLLGRLLEFVKKPSNVQKIGKIVQAIMERVGVIVNGGNMDLCRYFELSDGEYIVRDPVPLMVRFCVATQGGAIEGFLARFVRYLGDEQGAIKHACAVRERPSVPVLERLRLLCNLLETIVGLGCAEQNECVLRVYGAAIVLRDLFANASTADDRGKRATLVKGEDEFMTMRQAAAAKNVGGSSTESRYMELLSPLDLRIRALFEMEKVDTYVVPALVNIIRSDILVRTEADIRSILASKEMSVSTWQVDNLLPLIHKLFVMSSPWTFDDRFGEGSDSSGLRKEGEPSTTGSDLDGTDGSLAFLSSLSLDKENLNIFQTASLSKLQEESRIRIRQSSLGVLCMLLSGKLVQNDVGFIVELTRHHPGLLHGDTDKNKSCNPEGASTENSSKADKGEDERLLAVTRVADLFHREFAKSLTISLALSYLSLMAHLLRKRCKNIENTNDARDRVTKTLTSLLQEYSIRHQSVMRRLLKLLMDTFTPVSGCEFAKSVLVWLGNHPSLLNSKFVESDDGSKAKFRADEFDDEILEEANALDAGEESEEDDTSDCFNHEDYFEGAGQPVLPTIKSSVEGDQNRLDRKQRMISDDADPVTSLCLDETPEISLLSITSMLEFCDAALRKDNQRYREMLKSSSRSGLPTVDFFAERVTEVLQVFFDTPFMESFSTNWKAISPSLQKRIQGITHRLLECAQLLFHLLLKFLRTNARASETETHVQAASSIVKLLFEEAAEKCFYAAFKGEGRSNVSIQEAVNVSAAELFRFVESKECKVDKATRASVVAIRKILKSRKNRLLQVHSAKTLCSQSQGGTDATSGEYFRVSRPQKRQRLRSRNPDVDEWLQEEKDGDNYADLEDFVVALDADEL